MSRRPRKAGVFSRAFKLRAIRRILAGESVARVSEDLKVLRKDLYLWKQAYQRGGEQLLRLRGRPRKHDAALGQVAIANATELEQARKRIGELERKVGRQELELDFFGKALRCIEQGSEQPQQQPCSALSKSARRKAK